MSFTIHVLFLSCCLLSAPHSAGDADSDKDGLSDFHEIHKYGTNPKQADSDGDGVDDGDWNERCEYAYTVRSVVQVMRPVTIEYLNDDFQDARVLHEAEDYVELEVIHYPFNTVNDEIEATESWYSPSRDLKRWLEPGPTSDWTRELRTTLISELARDGIDIKKLSDRETVEQVSAWLMRRANSRDGYSTFITSFDKDGKPYVEGDLIERAEKGKAETGMALEEQWKHEISATGMYETKHRGSCSSSSIYISGCMRAIGIPTRTILCIPLVDAGDERERELVRTQIKHNKVRRIVDANVQKGINSWTSHTFNEVWVGGRWRRLNYSTLGQGILDENYLGLMTHVATFHDWADARMPETIGRRHSLHTQRQLFGGNNPYSTISLSDQFGVHSGLENPVLDDESLTVNELRWTDDASLPADIVANCKERGRFGLIAICEDLEGQSYMRTFLDGADARIWLDAPDKPRLGVGLDAGCWWYKQNAAYIYVPFGGADKRDLVEGVEYTASARNENKGFTLAVSLTVKR